MFLKVSLHCRRETVIKKSIASYFAFLDECFGVEAKPRLVQDEAVGFLGAIVFYCRKTVDVKTSGKIQVMVSAIKISFSGVYFGR